VDDIFMGEDGITGSERRDFREKKGILSSAPSSVFLSLFLGDGFSFYYHQNI